MVLDTDIVIRYLTNDDPQKASQFSKLLQGGERFTLTVVTCAEIYWTLTSFYQLSKEDAVRKLLAVISHKSIKCDFDLLSQSLLLLLNNRTSLIDAYEAVYAQLRDDGVVVSFDRGFDKLEGVTRKEPKEII